MTKLNVKEIKKEYKKILDKEVSDINELLDFIKELFDKFE
jgi:hypothetical protein